MEYLRSIVLKIGKAIAENESDTVTPVEIIEFAERYKKSNKTLQTLLPKKSRNLKNLGYPV